MILFTSKTCDKCKVLKAHLSKRGGLVVKEVDIGSVEGLAEAAFYEMVHMELPAAVIKGRTYSGIEPILKAVGA